MDIVFYNNLSDYNTLNKTLEEVTTISGTLRESCDVINPMIRIEHHGVIHANYCYIPDFGRYYFIVNQTILLNDIVVVELHVDVLESFKEEILNLSCMVNNSSSDNDPYLSGTEWVTTVKTTTSIKQFPNGLNENGEYILITAGG